MNVCYKCQKKIEQPEYCGECGKKVPYFSSKCQNCGAEARWVKFCLKCGNDLMEQARSEGLLSEETELTKGERTTVAPAQATGASFSMFDYSDNGDGTYTVTGLKNKSAIRVVIPEGTAVIGEGAFKGERMLDLTLPSSLLIIEKGAFEDCRRLRGVTFPEGLYSIEEAAFKGCEGLKSVSFPDSLSQIGDNAFAGCVRLEKPELSESVELGNNAFGAARNEASEAAVEPEEELSEAEVNDLEADLEAELLKLLGKEVSEDEDEDSEEESEPVKDELSEEDDESEDDDMDALIQALVDFSNLSAEERKAVIGYIASE